MLSFTCFFHLKFVLNGIKIVYCHSPNEITLTPKGAFILWVLVEIAIVACDIPEGNAAFILFYFHSLLEGLDDENT